MKNIIQDINLLGINYMTSLKAKEKEKKREREGKKKPKRKFIGVHTDQDSVSLVSPNLLK